MVKHLKSPNEQRNTYPKSTPENSKKNIPKFPALVSN